MKFKKINKWEKIEEIFTIIYMIEKISSIFSHFFFLISPKNTCVNNFLETYTYLSTPLRILKKVGFKASALNKGIPMALERLNIAKYTN